MIGLGRHAFATLRGCVCFLADDGMTEIRLPLIDGARLVQRLLDDGWRVVEKPARVPAAEDGPRGREERST